MPLTQGLVNGNGKGAVSPEPVVSSALLWRPWCVAAPGPPTSQMSSTVPVCRARSDGQSRRARPALATRPRRSRAQRAQGKGAWDLCGQVFVISPLPVTLESNFSQPHVASCPPVLLSLQGDDGPDVRGGSGDILLVHATETDRKGMAASSQWPCLCQKRPRHRPAPPSCVFSSPLSYSVLSASP